MRHLQAALGLDFDDLALVLVRRTLELASPDDRAPRLPVGLDPRAEHVLLVLRWIRQRGPDLRGRGVDLDLRGGNVVAHSGPPPRVRLHDRALPLTRGRKPDGSNRWTDR